jgi:hypothetical protein
MRRHMALDSFFDMVCNQCNLSLIPSLSLSPSPTHPLFIVYSFTGTSTHWHSLALPVIHISFDDMAIDDVGIDNMGINGIWVDDMRL